MTEADRNFTKLAHAASHALWDWQVNLTECNQRKKVSMKNAGSTTFSSDQTNNFPVRNIHD